MDWFVKRFRGYAWAENSRWINLDNATGTINLLDSATVVNIAGPVP